MAKRYRVGIIGFAHMHIYHLAALFGDHPQVEWVACADTPHAPELRTAPFTRDVELATDCGNSKNSAGL